jgi:archaemetzincin
MKAIHLLAVGAGSGGSAAHGEEVNLEMLDNLAAELARIFQVSCHVRDEPLAADFAFDPGRCQHLSTAILQRMESLALDPETRLLGVTGLDLYIPVLTFVFGEAQLEGCRALVSFHRLREEFYGLPPNEQLLRTRLTKEAVHELGHTFGLRHCHDWQCVMASTHDVERLDLKEGEFCRACLEKAALSGPAPRAIRFGSEIPTHRP